MTYASEILARGRAHTRQVLGRADAPPLRAVPGQALMFGGRMAEQYAAAYGMATDGFVNLVRIQMHTRLAIARASASADDGCEDRRRRFALLTVEAR